MEKEYLEEILTAGGMKSVSGGYENQDELIRDVCALIDYRLYLLYKYDLWVGPNNAMQSMLGLAVSRDEFEHNLEKATDCALCERVDAEEREQLALNDQLVALRIKKSDPMQIPLLYLCERFKLSGFELNCVYLAVAAEFDRKYQKLFAYLQDDMLQRSPTIKLAAHIFATAERGVEQCRFAFKKDRAFTALFDPDELAGGSLALNRGVYAMLNGVWEPKCSGLTMFFPNEPLDKVIFREELIQKLCALAGNSAEFGGIMLIGGAGAGKHFIVKQIVSRLEGACVFVEMSDENAEKALREGMLLARATGSFLCLNDFELLLEDERRLSRVEELLSQKQLYSDTLFILTEKKAHPRIDRNIMKFELELPNGEECERLFKFFGTGLPTAEADALEQCAAKFKFEPAKIKKAMRAAAALAEATGEPLSAETLHRCCYNEAAHKLDELADRLRPRCTWDELILPQSQKDALRSACNHVRYNSTVYDDWGFSRRVSYGRGVSLLLAGPPGTGKTMCAQIMAKELNMEIYKIQISQVVSKYIGETEKNLRAVFTQAKRSSSILFFDECDALFGKRSEVKDAHDRNANIEVAYLLQEIEDYDGMCILATNLIHNIDSAFIRRISFVVNFPFPDAEMRRQIFKSMLPAKAPVEPDVDWEFLAKKVELSGGSIKNIVIHAAFDAAAAGKAIGMKELMRAAVDEMRKNGMIVVKEDIKEYADLVF